MIGGEVVAEAEMLESVLADTKDRAERAEGLLQKLKEEQNEG